MNRKDLIGLKFPVYNDQPTPVGYRIINHSADVENYAGFLISCAKNTPKQFLLISFGESNKLKEDTEKGTWDHLPLIPSYESKND